MAQTAVVGRHVPHLRQRKYLGTARVRNWNEQQGADDSDGNQLQRQILPVCLIQNQLGMP